MTGYIVLFEVIIGLLHPRRFYPCLDFPQFQHCTKGMHPFVVATFQCTLCGNNACKAVALLLHFLQNRSSKHCICPKYITIIPNVYKMFIMEYKRISPSDSNIPPESINKGLLSTNKLTSSAGKKQGNKQLSARPSPNFHWHLASCVLDSKRNNSLLRKRSAC